MTNPLESLPSDPLSEQLSALADGELTPQEAAAFWVGQGGAGEQARADWHAFQLIGDVLRSEDLASSAQHDAAFLQSLRVRLAHEPVVLAPEPVRKTPRTVARRVWAWPSAAAVGVVVVSAAMWNNTRDVGGPGGALPVASMAQKGNGVQAVTVASQPASLAQPQAGAILRDPQIDRYLAAHQQFVGSTALGAPSGFIRNAAVDVPRH